MTRLRLWLCRLLLPRGWEVREKPVGWVVSVGNGVYRYVPDAIPDPAGFNYEYDYRGPDDTPPKEAPRG
jgi:hypothetical protein